MDDYPNIQRWWNDIKTVPGFEENEEGAKILSNAVKAKLTQGF